MYFFPTLKRKLLPCEDQANDPGAAGSGSSRTEGPDRGGARARSSDEDLQTLAICGNWAIFQSRPITAVFYNCLFLVI